MPPFAARTRTPEPKQAAAAVTPVRRLSAAATVTTEKAPSKENRVKALAKRKDDESPTSGSFRIAKGAPIKRKDPVQTMQGSIQSEKERFESTGHECWLPLQYFLKEGKEKDPTLQPPDKRSSHAMFYYEKSLYVFGGCGRDYSEFTVFCLPLDTRQWSVVATESKPPLARVGFSYWVHGSSAYIWGGGKDVFQYSDLFEWRFEVKQWHQLLTRGPAPAKRNSHATTQEWDGKVFIFGGYSKTDLLGDCWVLDTTMRVWREVRTGTPAPADPYALEEDWEVPPPRACAAMAAWNGKVFLHGGWNGARYLGDMWVLDEQDGFEWRKIHTHPAIEIPIPVTSDQLFDPMIKTARRKSICEPEDEAKANVEAQPESEPASPTTQRGPSGGTHALPARRMNHALVLLNNEKMYLFGGSSNSFYNDLWLFDPKTERWEKTNPTGQVPLPRSNFSWCVDMPAGRVFLYGGRYGPHRLSDLACISFSVPEVMQNLVKRPQKKGKAQARLGALREPLASSTVTRADTPAPIPPPDARVDALEAVQPLNKSTAG